MVVCDLERDVWGFSRVTMGNSGNLSCGPREFQPPFELRGSRTLLSIHCRGIGPQDALKGEYRGLSGVAVGKPWLPSTCDSDLWELLRVFRGSQEYCGVGGASRDSTGVSAKEEGIISS